MFVVSNAGDDRDGDEFETDDVCNKRARGLHFIWHGSVVGWNVISLLVSQPFEIAVNARQHVSCSTVSISKQQLCQPSVFLFVCFAGVHSLISCLPARVVWRRRANGRLSVQ